MLTRGPERLRSHRARPGPSDVSLTLRPDVPTVASQRRARRPDQTNRWEGATHGRRHDEAAARGGVHFGHQTRRWNPKMKRFIFGERNGIYIIDLHQTLAPDRHRLHLRARPRRRRRDDPVRRHEEAGPGPGRGVRRACGMPYVNERWLGGMLTNFETIAGRVRKLAELEAARDCRRLRRACRRRRRCCSRASSRSSSATSAASAGCTRLPDAIFVIDTKKEHIAVTEANKLGIPVDRRRRHQLRPRRHRLRHPRQRRRHPLGAAACAASSPTR